MKIAVIGTHGTGKTTLVYLLAAESKKRGKNCKTVQEVARSSPFPLNDGFSVDGANWIITTQIQKELNAKVAKTELIICDRSSIDPIMYLDAGDHEKSKYESLFFYAKDWMKTYDKIVIVRMGNKPPINDGVRSLDFEFQKKVQKQFNLFVYHLDFNKFVNINSDLIFEKTSEQLYNEIIGDL